MSTTFVSDELWSHLTAATKTCAQPCDVAVAYFSKGAHRLLPLLAGSRLVVDASERAVRSGQTHPDSLRALVKRGVSVFNVPNLHAKVYVLGRFAYVGSANASGHSASLIEALVRTDEPRTVSGARRFIREQCLHALTPKFLIRLQKLYQPPRLPGGKPGMRMRQPRISQAILPRLLLAQLELEEWSEGEQKIHDDGMVEAEKLRQFGRGFELDSFRMTGRNLYRRGDVVVQVVDEGGGVTLVDAPGNVVKVISRQRKRGKVSFIYLERPARRRRSLAVIATKLGRGSKKRLRRDGVVRDSAFARALLNLWAN